MLNMIEEKKINKRIGRLFDVFVLSFFFFFAFFPFCLHLDFYFPSRKYIISVWACSPINVIRSFEQFVINFEYKSFGFIYKELVLS